VEGEIAKTKQMRKKGCFLLLGRKGGVGITYPDCDVTISLDDGHNIDEQKQRNYRALTEANGKTIGISVDMNIQRTYYLLNDTILKFQKTSPNKMNFIEILHFFREYDIYIFNPQEFKMGNVSKAEITRYFEKVCDKMHEDMEEDTILDNLECQDLLEEKLSIRDYISSNKSKKEINLELEGKQKNCPKPEETLTSSGLVTTTGTTDFEGEAALENTNQIVEENFQEELIKINKTKELCKKIIPILCLLSRTGLERDLEKILRNEKYHELFNSIIKRKFC
jgi:hypothetical protein